MWLLYQCANINGPRLYLCEYDTQSGGKIQDWLPFKDAIKVGLVIFDDQETMNQTAARWVKSLPKNTNVPALLIDNI